MGQNQPRGNQSPKQIKHSKFPKVAYPLTLFQRHAQTMEVELPCDEASYKKWRQEVKGYERQFLGKRYLLLPEEHEYEGAGMCSREGSVKITYPRLPYVLEDEIQTIKAQSKNFSQAEIWKLLHVLVSAKKEYLQLGKSFSYDLGNVNPRHIFLNDSNQIKVANPLSWPGYIDGYKNAVLRQPSYLSPQDMKLLELGAVNNDANGRSEEFAMGMTLLSVGLVENLEGLYNMDYPTFKVEEFQSKLNVWKTTVYYSEVLRAVVVGLLEVDPENRLTFQQVGEFLKPHASNISAGMPLVISKVTPKIQKVLDHSKKELPDLLKMRFEKQQLKKQRENRSVRSLPKESKKDSVPKEAKLPKAQSTPNEVRKGQNLKQVNLTNRTTEKLQSTAQGTELMIGKAVQQLFQPVSTIQPASITRVKSQTRFTYSNRPLQNVSPMKFVLNNQNGTVSQQPILTTKEKGQSLTSKSNNPNNTATKLIHETSIMSSPRVNRITYESTSTPTVRHQNNPQNPVSTEYLVQQKITQIDKPSEVTKRPEEQKAAQIAQRLINQGLRHTDSQVHAQQSNRQSTSTEINKLQLLQAVNVVQAPPAPQANQIFSPKSDYTYHTYAQILINTDFNSAWDEFLNMISHPEAYFAELQDKITVSQQIIQIPPGKVKLQTNKEEGKVHLANVSQKCVGEILGGVSKNSANQVQVWFNSSYAYDGKPFPANEYFKQGLEKLKQKLEAK